MNKELDHRDDELIDLGSVTEETKGPGFINNDGVGGKLPFAGLSDD